MTATARKLGVGDRLAVVRCNHCKTLVASEHRTAHALECRSKRNRQKLGSINLEQKGQPTYAIIFSKKTGEEWSPPLTTYVNAHNVLHARGQFLAGEDTSKLHIIEVGLAIGWFQDAQGNITG